MHSESHCLWIFDIYCFIQRIDRRTPIEFFPAQRQYKNFNCCLSIGMFGKTHKLRPINNNKFFSINMYHTTKVLISSNRSMILSVTTSVELGQLLRTHQQQCTWRKVKKIKRSAGKSLCSLERKKNRFVS